MEYIGYGIVPALERAKEKAFRGPVAILHDRRRGYAIADSGGEGLRLVAVVYHGHVEPAHGGASFANIDPAERS